MVELTQNYLKFLIQSAVLGMYNYVISIVCDGICNIKVTIAVTGEGGMLIHCVSGWDRTPLFVSLLRLSLWAVSQAVYFTAIDFFVHVCFEQDGRVHQSLCAAEILYFTVAYDWLLFG